MELTKQQMFELNKKYLHAGGNRCPICDRGNAIADDTLYPEDGRNVSCDKCGAKWRDIYKLVKIEDVVVGTVAP